MFTVCPKCALTLVVTAADLRIAQGYVRCGRCLNVFNALARLSEERPAAAPEPPPETLAAEQEQVLPVAEQEQGLAPQEQVPPSPEYEEAAPPRMEESDPAPFAPIEPPASIEPSSTIDATGEIEIELDASALATSMHAPATQSFAPHPVDPVPEASQLEPHPAGPMPEASQLAPLATTPITDAQQPLPAAAVVAEPAESASLAAAPHAQQTNIAPPPESAFELRALRPRAGLAWQLGAGTLAIALALQIVNHYRDALAASPALRGPLTAVYSAMGVRLAPRWNIHAYDVRQLGASVAGAAAGEIIVRASVKNSAPHPQPLPLLRVTLQDRFGNRIAARDVPPGDYLPSSVAPSSLLAAGSRVDATMVFVDPGPQAVGFEIDACLRQRSGEVACAHGP